MKTFTGQALRWEWRDGVIELTLDRPPANEIGTVMLGEMERFVEAAAQLAPETAACVISSAQTIYRVSMQWPPSSAKKAHPVSALAVARCAPRLAPQATFS